MALAQKIRDLLSVASSKLSGFLSSSLKVFGGKHFQAYLLGVEALLRSKASSPDPRFWSCLEYSGAHWARSHSSSSINLKFRRLQ